MDRTSFKQRMQSLKTYREQNPGKGYWEWRNSLPDNLRYTDDSEYDMQAAYKSGAQPVLEDDGLYHLPSRDPKSGRILKSSYHNTYWKALEEDAKLGYKPIMINGNTYTKRYDDTWAFQNGGEKLPTIGKTTTDLYGNKTHYIATSIDDDGTVNLGLPNVVITPRNNLSLEGAVNKGRREAAPYVGALIGGAILGSMSSAGLLSPVVNPIDAASVITDPDNPLNWLPFGLHFGNRAYKVGKQILDPKKRAAHAYVNVSPVGYDNIGKRAKSWIGDMLKGEDADIQHPKWSIDELGKSLIDYLGPDVKNAHLIAGYTRDDAWRIYNGLKPKYGMYIKNADGTYSYDLKKINELSDNTFRPEIDYEKGAHYDYVTGAGGGLTKYENKDIAEQGAKTYGVQTIEDIWDLHPFSRPSDVITKRLTALETPFKLYNRVRNAGATSLKKLANRFKYDDKQISDYLKSASEYEQEMFDPDMFPRSERSYIIGETINKIADKIIPKKQYYEYSPLVKLNKTLKQFEVGSVSGGKPFKMHTEIPYTKTMNFSDINKPTINVDYGFIQNDGLLFPTEVYQYEKNLKNLNLDSYIKSLNDNYIQIDLNDIYNPTKRIFTKKYKDGGEVEPPYPQFINGQRVNRITGKPIATGQAKPLFDLEDFFNFTPLGDAITVKNTYDAAKQNDWSTAALSALTLIPFVPTTVKQFNRKYKGVTPKVKREIPTVNKNQVQEQINDIEKERLRRSRLINEADNQGYKIAERLMEDPAYIKRAAKVQKEYGDDYLTTYADILQAYNENPDLLMKSSLGSLQNGARARMEATSDAVRRHMNGGQFPGMGEYNYRIDPTNMRDLTGNVTDHEWNHYVDYLKNKQPDGQGSSNLFKRMSEDIEYSDNPLDIYYGKPTEQKAYMNQLREYMFQNGIISSRDEEVSKELLQDVLNNLTNRNMDSIVRASRRINNMDNYTKWFNSIPLLGLGAMGINKYYNQQKEK